MINLILLFFKNMLIRSYNKDKYKNHEEFAVYGFEDGCSDDSTLILCKNCEEFIDQRALGRGYLKSHGKWKPISNNYKKYYKDRFNAQIKWRKKRYGNPLQPIQYIKAARAISHEVYPTKYKQNRGRRGHYIRERLRKELLNDVGIIYKEQNRNLRKII